MMKGPTFIPEEDMFGHSIIQYLILQNLKNYLLLMLLLLTIILFCLL